MPAKLVSNQRNKTELVSQTPTTLGWKFRSVKWHHRAVALANSRPISPQPIMPNRISLLVIFPSSDVDGPLWSNAFVDDRHECSSNPLRMLMLNDVPAVHN